MPAINVVIIGASGAIGSALTKQYAAKVNHRVFAFSRTPMRFAETNVSTAFLDYNDESSIFSAFETLNSIQPHVVIIATGLLHQNDLQPEKSIKKCTQDHMADIFSANAIGPALVLKHLLPKMSRDSGYSIAALSARVGSITDNRLGGWYSYRASKAALNMIIKTTSIEAMRLNPDAIVVGLHPGTVDSSLSEPFQAQVPKQALFTADFAAKQLRSVINNLTPLDTGHLIAWDGQKIDY